MTFSDICAMMYEFQLWTGHMPRTLHLTADDRMALIHDLGDEFRHHILFDGQKEEILGLELVISDATGVT